MYRKRPITSNKNALGYIRIGLRIQVASNVQTTTLSRLLLYLLRRGFSPEQRHLIIVDDAVFAEGAPVELRRSFTGLVVVIAQSSVNPIQGRGSMAGIARHSDNLS